MVRNAQNFTEEWPGGYFEGDPTDPFAPSTYLTLGYVSTLYATYLVCLKPYVTPETNVLEIGPGRGAWTKAILGLGPRKVWALDAASDEHSGFSEYVGRSDRVEHHQVVDESLVEVPDGSVDLFFSFGVFCHLPEQVIENYLTSLARKMKPGAHGFFLVADFEQYERAAAGPDAVDRLFSLRRFTGHRIAHNTLTRLFPGKLRVRARHEDEELGLSRWYDIGKDRAAKLAEAAGFVVLEQDVGTCPRDPLLHILRPA